MIQPSAAELASAAGIGVAGNFAGHLEQAGEAGDFAAVAAPAAAPKGIFPWYLPDAGGFLGEFPLSSDSLAIPAGSAVDLQIEPEAGVLFAARYEQGRVAGLTPLALGAFNDCSIRREGAKKISEKKNWGAASKGFAARCFSINELEPDGACGSLRLASFLRRDDAIHAYGHDSPLDGYSYFGSQLIDWIVEKLVSQRGGDTPLEDVGEQLASCGQPARLLVGIGATRYTDFGARNYLQPGDESIVIVYDETVHSSDEVATNVAERSEHSLASASTLTQLVS